MTRRRLIGVTAGLAVTSTVNPFGQRRAEAQSATPVSLAPGTVETIHGTVEVPANPTRIVTVNFPSAVALLELGVLPVGIPSYLPALPPGYPSTAEIPVIENEAGELDLEKILSLNPDLIVGSDWKDSAQQLAPYEQLSAIAPTALFEWTMAAGNWATEAAGCAAAIGKTAEFEQLRSDYEARVAQIKMTYADTLSAITWDIISSSDTHWYLYGPTSSHGKVAIAAGIRLNAAANQTEGYLEYSFEEFNLLQNTGALLIRSAGDDSLNALAQVATYTSLPAVTAQHIYTSDYFFPSSYGLSTALLADIETALNALSV